jgi:hypothetical protein
MLLFQGFGGGAAAGVIQRLDRHLTNCWCLGLTTKPETTVLGLLLTGGQRLMRWWRASQLGVKREETVCAEFAARDFSAGAG